MSSEDICYGDLIVEIGRLFINRPFKAGTLEGSEKEKLIINVSAFDCTTFVETVLALARCAAAGKMSPDTFRKHLKLIRYRQGKIDGYSSRLHYFTDWLRDNEQKALITDLTRTFGGKAQRKKINFMTAHKELYPALENKKQLARMTTLEHNLSRRTFHIIEKDKISARREKIENGDILALTTHESGLDIAHVGFAVRQGRNVHLLHASQQEGKVVTSKKTLIAYLKSNKRFAGIIVARPLF
jgi:hypothetical protein